MPQFYYESLATSGQRKNGVCLAENRVEAIEKLHARAEYPYHLEVAGQKKLKNAFHRNRGIGTKELVLFCRQTSVMINAGIQLQKCLETLEKQTSHYGLRKALREILSAIREGASLSQAMEAFPRFFPPLLVQMTAAGEESGTLALSMERMAEHYGRELRLKRSVKGALMYPVVLSCLSIGVVSFMMIFVLPTFVGIFESEQLPLPAVTRLLLRMGISLSNRWYLWGLLLITSWILIRRLRRLPSMQRLLDRWRLRIPVFRTVVQSLVLGRFCRTLAALLASGVPMLHAMHVTGQAVGNIEAQRRLHRAKERLRNGDSLTDSLRGTELFSATALGMVHVGESTGTLDEMLQRLAILFDEEAEGNIKRMTQLAEPFLIVVMAFVVGFLVVAMVLPMFDLLNVIPLE